MEEWNQAKSKYIWIIESIGNWDLFLLQAPNAAKNVRGWHWVRVRRLAAQSSSGHYNCHAYTSCTKSTFFCNHQQRGKMQVFCLIHFQWNFTHFNNICVRFLVTRICLYRWNLAIRIPSEWAPLSSAQEALLDVSRAVRYEARVALRRHGYGYQPSWRQV